MSLFAKYLPRDLEQLLCEFIQHDGLNNIELTDMSLLNSYDKQSLQDHAVQYNLNIFKHVVTRKWFSFDAYYCCEMETFRTTNGKLIKSYVIELTLLQLASALGYIEYVKFLCNLDKYNTTPLSNIAIGHFAGIPGTGNIAVGHFAGIPGTGNIAVGHPASKMPDNAMDLACIGGHLEVVKFLCGQENYDLSANNNRSLAFALCNGRQNIAEYLYNNDRVISCGLGRKYSTSRELVKSVIVGAAVGLTFVGLILAALKYVQHVRLPQQVI